MYAIFSVLALAIACSAVSLNGNDASNRIANGEYANNLQYPYAVSIQLTNNTSNVATRGHMCGGALVTLQHVLTAASCMYTWNADGTRAPINIANYRVFAGAHLLSNDTSPNNYRSIAQFIVHPNYHGIPSYLNDIAIVYLTTPFASTTVVPLSLPAANYEPADFTDCVVVGWGATTSGSAVTASVQQKYISQYIYDQHMCTTVYNSQSLLPNIFPSMVCASSYDIVSVGCNGDTGNAIVCGNTTLTGILALHGNCAPSSFPEIYTRVSNFTNWIQPLTGSASSFTAGASILLFVTLIQTALVNLLS